MHSKFIASAFCWSLFATAVYAGASTNIEELKAQLAAKREQLDRLSGKIIKLDEAVGFFKQKMHEFGSMFKEAKERKFLSENPGKKITEKDMRDWQDAFLNEWARLIKDFTDSKNRTGKYIVNDEFFNGIEEATTFKFYMLKYFHDVATLHELFSDWEQLSNEICALAIQIDSIKGL
jgi:hypothetical protein